MRAAAVHAVPRGLAGGVTAPVFLLVFIRNGQPLCKFVPGSVLRAAAVSCPEWLLGV